MRTVTRVLYVAAGIGMWAVAAVAVAPVAPIEVSLTQPDGATFKAYPKGSGYADWMETAEGHTILKRNGAWYYARVGLKGELAPTENLVGSLPAEALDAMPRHLRPPVDESKFILDSPRVLAQDHGVALATAQPTLVILVDFSDITLAYSDDSFRDLIFGAAGSVKAAFAENSYGAFSVEPAAETYGTPNDGVVHVSLPYAHPNFGKTCCAARNQLFRDAVIAADPYIHYAAYDSDGNVEILGRELAINIIAAGYENSYGGDATPTPKVWAQMSTLAAADQAVCDGKNLRSFCVYGERHATGAADEHQATYGVMAHENGHLMLGLPDLYDRDGNSAGIGRWGLMGSGNWTFVSGWAGNSPAHLTGWDKARVGFVTPEEILSPASGAVVNPTDGFASLKRLWVDKYKFGESFLLESRRLSNLDAGLPGAGLVITHCDDRVVTQNDDQTHKLVDIEEADGLNQMDTFVNRGDDGDPWPGVSGATAFNAASAPGSLDYTLASTGVAVTNITGLPGGAMSADVTPRPIPLGGNIGYDESGSFLMFGYGCGPTYLLEWTGLRVQNTFLGPTVMEWMDGLDFLLRGPATVDLYYYTSLAGGVPSGLIYSQTGIQGVTGWNRFFFPTPQYFPIEDERGFVLKLQSASATYPAMFDKQGPISGRSYVDCDGAGTFARAQGDLNQRALFSSTMAPPGVPGGVTGTGMQVSKSGTDIVVTWDTSTCAAPASYSLIHGTGADLPSAFGGTYGLTGARCNIGPSPYTWTDSPAVNEGSPLIWWLIVANDGAGTEGSWGRNSGAIERTGPGTNGCSGFCSVATKATNNTCGGD